MKELFTNTRVEMVAGSQPDPTDEHLMEMIQAHDRDALDLLQQRHARIVKVLSMKVLHNDADAEDLLQDVFLEIWDRARNYSPLKGRPLSWISTLARRRSIDRLRKRETYSRVKDRFSAEGSPDRWSWTQVHEEVVQGEQSECLERALLALPNAQRIAIHLAYREEMSQREIAAHTGIPLGTIKTRLELGLRKLAAALYGCRDLIRADGAAGTRNRPAMRTVKPRATPIS